MNTWFEIKALAKNSRRWTISIYGVIGEGGVTAAKFAEELAKVPADAEITLAISSKGGSVYDGLAIYEQIAAIRERVVARVEGIAASMASVVMLAAREVTASENSTIMVHNPVIAAAGNAADLRASADILDKVAGQLVGVYERKTGKTRAELEAVLAGADGRGTWMTAAEAQAFGLVDRLFGALQVAAVAPADCGAVVDVERFMPQAPQAPQAADGTPIEQPAPTPEPTPAERIAQLEADLAAAQVRIGTLAEEGSRYLAQANAAAELLAASHTELELVRARLAEQQAARAALEAEAASLRSRLAELESAQAVGVAEVRAQLDGTLADLAAMTTARETLEADFVALRASLTAERDTLRAELDTLRQASRQARAESAIGAVVASGRLKDDPAVRGKWVAAYLADEAGTADLLASLPEISRQRGAAPVINSPEAVAPGDADRALLARYREMPTGPAKTAFYSAHADALYRARALE